MKKTMRIFLFVCVFLFCFSLSVLAANDTEPCVIIKAENGEVFRISPENHTFYLPSAANPHALTLGTGEPMDITAGKTTDERGVVCYRIPLTETNEIYTFYFDESLPFLWIETSSGLSYIESSKENRDKQSKISVINENGDVEYSDASGTSSEIKARGNATFTYYKKPYQIKLGKKTALLGMESSKTWILLANYTDQTAIHNALAFALGDALDIPYNIDYRFVNLYIDGKYRGLYMLTEKVQVGGARVDITDLEEANEIANNGKKGDDFSIAKQTSGELIENSILTYYTYAKGMVSPEDITGGYIVELDINRGLSEPCHFVTENGMVYTVKAPEYASREEMEYIAELFADLEEAVFSENGYNRKGIHYSEYIDMESFAGVYTIQELMKNWDAYLSSMFFFKDADRNGERSKIYMGPLWDMDNTLGNINFNYEFGQDTAYLWAQNGVFQDLPRDYAKKLMKHIDFQVAVANAYDKAYLAVTEYLSEGGWLEETVETIRSSVMMERTRWKYYDSNSWLLNAAGYKSNVKFMQFAEYGTAHDEQRNTALGFMRYYLITRMEKLLSLIGNGEVPTPPPETETTETEISLTEKTEETSFSISEEMIATATASIKTGETGESIETTAQSEKDSSKDISMPLIIFAVILIAVGCVTVIFIKKKQ